MAKQLPASLEFTDEPKKQLPASLEFTDTPSKKLPASLELTDSKPEQPTSIFEQEPTPAPSEEDDRTKAGWVKSGVVTNEELQKIAAKHPGVKVDELRDWVNYYGGSNADASLKDWAKSTLGMAAESLAVGVPQFLAKKAQDETHERALDDLSDLVNEKKSTLQAAGELGGSIFGSLGVAGAVGKLVPAAAKAYQTIAAIGGGATSGLTHSKSGEEAEGAAIGGTIGAVVPVIGAAGGKLMKLGNEAVEKFGLTGTKTLDETIEKAFQEQAPKVDIGKKLLEGREPLTQDEVRTFLGAKDYDQLLKQENPSLAISNELATRTNNIKKDIAKTLKGERDLDAYNEAARDLEGTSKILDTYEENSKNQLLKQIADQGGDVRPLTSAEDWAQSLMDAKPLNEITDKRYGSKLSRTMDTASQKTKELEIAFEPLQQEGYILHRKSNPAADLDIIKQVESGKITSPEAKAWADTFQKMRDTAEVNGLYIRRRDNYVPAMRLPLQEYKAAIVKRLEESGPEDKELLAELTRWNGGVTPKEEQVGGLVNQIKGATSAVYNNAVGVQASVTKARDEVLPMWLRETNLAKLQDKWVGQVKRQIALEPHIQEMQKVAKIAGFKGDTVTQERLTNHIDDLLGNRLDMPAEVLAQEKKYLGDLEDRIANSSGIEKKLLQARVVAPRVASNLSSIMYANLLSSPKTSIQNLASPALGAFSELGQNYGTKIYLEAMTDVVKAVRDGVKVKVKPHMEGILGAKAGTEITLHNPKLIAQNEGLIGGANINNILDYQRHLAQKGIDTVNGASMALFNTTDNISRGTVAFMGKRLANDLIQDPKKVSELIKSPSYRNYLGKIAASGDKQKLEEETIKYLHGHTLLNFDKIGMSGYARRAGPMMRAFTKYPSYYLGRAAQPLYEKGLVKGSAETLGAYGSPLATFWMIDNVLDSEDSDTIKALTTANGLKGWAAGTSISPFIESNFGVAKTPLTGIVTSGGSGIKSLIRDETEASDVLTKWLQQAASIVMPGQGVLKILGEDLPAIKGEAVDKKENVIERRIEGVKSIFD